MKTKTTPSVVSTIPAPSTPAAVVASGFTLGLDLGDCCHHVCVLDATGQIVREGNLPNTRPALKQLLAGFPRATVAMERGDPHGAFVRDSHYCDSRGLLFARDYWSICSSEEVCVSVTSHPKAPNNAAQATPMNGAVLPLRFLRQKSVACWMAAVTLSSGAQILS
jgi:hypothetical protein